MKKIFFTMFAACLVALGYIMYTEQDFGSLHIQLADFNLETDLLKTSTALLAFVLVLLLLSSFYSLLLYFFSFFGSRRRLRLSNVARQSLEKGLIELAEGRFDKAEKLFLHKITYSDNALLCYLSAARAAQKQGAHDRRDDYLRKAHTTKPTADIAIGLTQAELQLSHEQYEQALANLNNLHTISPKHVYVLYLLTKTLKRLQEWGRLCELLPELHRLDVFTPEKLSKLEVTTWTGLYHQVTDINLPRLTELWKETPKPIKGLPEIIESYACQLITLNAHAEAEQVLRNHLNNSWDESVVILYSELDVLSDTKQLDHAEDWLRQHQHNPYLLLALGKMCILRNLWGKARNYLEASLAIAPMPQTYLALAKLLEEQMDEPELAQDNYKKGLLLFNNSCDVTDDHIETDNVNKEPNDDVIETT